MNIVKYIIYPSSSPCPSLSYFISYFISQINVFCLHVFLWMMCVPVDSRCYKTWMHRYHTTVNHGVGVGNWPLDFEREWKVDKSSNSPNYFFSVLVSFSVYLAVSMLTFLLSTLCSQFKSCLWISHFTLNNLLNYRAYWILSTCNSIIGIEILGYSFRWK